MEIKNFLKWIIIKDIYCTKNLPNLTIGNLARSIGVKQNHPYFHEVLGKLVDAEVIYIEEINHSAKLVQINHKKLKKLIVDSEVYGHFREFVTTARPLDYCIP